MYDLILAAVVFHTLSSLALLLGCAVASFDRARPRATAHVWIDQSEIDADAILSASVVDSREFAPAQAPSANVAVA